MLRWWWSQQWWRRGHGGQEPGAQSLQRVQGLWLRWGVLGAGFSSTGCPYVCYRDCRMSCCAPIGCWLHCPGLVGQGMCLGPTQCCFATSQRWGALKWSEVGLEVEPFYCWLFTRDKKKKESVNLKKKKLLSFSELKIICKIKLIQLDLIN